MTAIELTVRFAKLKNDDLDWWMKTVEAMVPKAKQKLAIFDEAVSKLKTSGDLQGMATLEIESDERWVTRRKSVLRDSLKKDTELKGAARGRSTNKSGGTVRKRKITPTVGENQQKKSRLGMLGMSIPK